MVSDSRPPLTKGGRRIVEQEQKGRSRAGYGEAVIKALAERLTAEFGRGFSASNLAYMRSFYLLYPDRASIPQPATGQSDGERILQSPTANSSVEPNAQPMADDLQIFQSSIGKSAPALARRPFALSWTHYLFLLGIKNPDERSFYEIEAAAQGWTVSAGIPHRGTGVRGTVGV